MNEFSKDAAFKINIQKYAEFLNTSNKLSEREFKKTIPFTIASKTNKKTNKQTKKNLGVNLTKVVKDLYSES